MSLSESELFAVLGESGIRQVVSAFYRQVPGDDLLGPMYPESDLAGAENRLYGFLVFRFGGPQNYIQERGHPRLRMRHAPFAVNHQARDRWMQLMTNAVNEVDLDETAARTMLGFFDQVATFLINS